MFIRACSYLECRQCRRRAAGAALHMFVRRACLGGATCVATANVLIVLISENWDDTTCVVIVPKVRGEERALAPLIGLFSCKVKYTPLAKMCDSTFSLMGTSIIRRIPAYAE
jgi:hypothetical protein